MTIATVLQFGVLLVGAFLQEPNPDSARKPASLLAFEQARSALNAQFSVLCYTPGGAPGQFRSTVVRDQVAFFRDGRTTDGLTGYRENGTPVYDLQQAFLVTSDGAWEKYQKISTAQARLGGISPSARLGVLDFRSIGMTPYESCLLSSPREAVSRSFDPAQPAVTYSETKNADGLFVVEAKCAQTGHATVWYLDPALSWNAVRVEDRVGDAVVESVTTEYEPHGDAWVPVKAVSADGTGDVQGVAEISYAKVNSPDLPKQLTPNDIGVLVGMPVNVEQGGQGSQMRWTGEKLVPGPEYVAMEGRGEVHTDPALVEEWRQAMARAGVNQPSPRTSQPTSQPQSFADVEQRIQKGIETLRAPQLDEWDKYVLGVIEKYKLNDEQRQKCLAILKDCKQQRDNHFQKRAAEIERLRTRKLPTAGDAKLAEEQLELLMKPVRKIFDRLKERVMKVPTRKQIEEAK